MRKVKIGTNGNNKLTALDGLYTLKGLRGNDTYSIDSKRDLVVERAGHGTDKVQVFGLENYTLTRNVENLVVVDTDGEATFRGNNLSNILDARRPSQGFHWEVNLFGFAGNDKLYGGAASDFLDGGRGRDLMGGGKGNEIYIVDNVFDRVVEGSGQGTDQIRSSVSFTLPANVENLFLTGLANVNATGNDQNNYIAGNSGANVIFGGLGYDYLVGGAGPDEFVWTDEDQTGRLINDFVDTIGDFSKAQGDKIDLSAFDTNTATPADDAFTFIGTADFDAPGQIRYREISTGYAILINTVGTYNQEMVIKVISASAPEADWFIL
jgi:Ca2+-binding RTX toxin-like protein